MPTSTAAPSIERVNRASTVARSRLAAARAAAGFTLIEIGLVLLIIASSSRWSCRASAINRTPS